MLQDNTQNRASAFVVTYIHRVLKEYRKANPNTPEGQEWLRKLNTNQWFSVPPIPIDSSWEANIQMLNDELASQEYATARAEYEKLRLKGKSNPHWYSFFEGPNSIEQLAAQVQLSALYETYYRTWSQPLHGTDIFANKILPDQQGNSSIVQLRYVLDVQKTCAQAFTISYAVLPSLVRSFLPQHEEDLRTWLQAIFAYGVWVNGPEIINLSMKPMASDNTNH
jgi:hypothetical protein